MPRKLLKEKTVKSLLNLEPGLQKGLLQKELKVLAIVSLAVLIILKIAFYKEPTINVLKFGLALIHFSLLPGYTILLNFSKNLELKERVILSFPLGFGLYTIFAYYLNLVVSLSVILWLPLIIILISVLVYAYQNKKSGPVHD